MTTLTIKRSGTDIEREYRRAVEVLARATPRPAPFDPSVYEPAAVTLATEMWRVRMRAEHESVPVLAALAGQLAAAGATLDVQGMVFRMAVDEIRHAEVCGETIRALGGEPACELGAEPPRLPDWPGVGVEERALRNVIFGHALVEMVNSAQLVDILDTMTDPCLRDATRLLLADEVHHAAFGFDYLEAWGPWLEANPAVVRSLGAFLRRAFAELERVRAGRADEPRQRGADHIALGIPDPGRLTVVLRETVEGAIVPALTRFGIDAEAAWHERA